MKLIRGPDRKDARVLSSGTNYSAGVAVLFIPCLSVKMCSSKEVCSVWLLVIKAEIYNMGFVFINVYAPNTGRERGVLFGCLRQVAPEETGGRRGLELYNRIYERLKWGKASFRVHGSVKGHH
jgi:hypothetical protein